MDNIVETKNQRDLPGVAGPGISKPEIPEISRAVEAYINARDARVTLSARETETREKVIALLHEHAETLGRAPDGTIRYEFDSKLVTLAPTKEKLRVKEVDSDDDGGGEDDAA